MFTYLFWALGLYILIRFVFNFVIPVFRATRQMKSQMRDFQNRMQNNQEQENEHSNARQHSKPTVKQGDYIDFEEIK